MRVLTDRSKYLAAAAVAVVVSASTSLSAQGVTRDYRGNIAQLPLASVGPPTTPRVVPGAPVMDGIHGPSRWAMLETGEFVAAMTNEGAALVFGADGSHLRRVGRLGQGPGEFSGRGRLTVFASGGDEFGVYDH